MPVLGYYTVLHLDKRLRSSLISIRRPGYDHHRKYLPVHGLVLHCVDNISTVQIPQLHIGAVYKGLFWLDGEAHFRHD